jgi:hypothetical protein
MQCVTMETMRTYSQAPLCGRLAAGKGADWRADTLRKINPSLGSNDLILQLHYISFERAS